MDLTRRELCFAFPVALLPALLAAESAQQPTALASSMYPFDTLPLQTTNDAQFRAVLKGKLATGESVGRSLPRATRAATQQGKLSTVRGVSDPSGLLRFLRTLVWVRAYTHFAEVRCD